jgi:hypothetical protein
MHDLSEAQSSDVTHVAHGAYRADAVQCRKHADAAAPDRLMGEVDAHADDALADVETHVSFLFMRAHVAQNGGWSLLRMW